MSLTCNEQTEKYCFVYPGKLKTLTFNTSAVLIWKELCVLTLNQESNVRSSSKLLVSLDINLMDDVSVTPIFKNRSLSYYDACSPGRIMFSTLD